MRMIEDKVWLGSETSLQAALKAEETRAQMLAAGTTVERRERDIPRLVSVEDGVAQVSIKGSLVNDDDADWNTWLGLTGYPEIREAMVYAATNPEVKHILLNIDSGGGAVSGVSDTGKLIRLINDNVKPVTAFTDSAMFSAAYWLGSSAGNVYASKAAGVGSIGVIATHMERSEMLKEAGIGVTVVRAGKYKALANGVEKLTEEGKAQIQASVDAAYKIFVDHVAEMRGKTYEFADSVMAQGREFFGQAAADAGLVDGIKSSSDVLTEIQAKLIDASNSFMDNRGKQVSNLRVESTGETGMGKQTLSEQEIAALASGVQLGASAPADAPANVEEPVQTGAQSSEAPVEAAPAAEAPQAAKEDVTSSATLQFMAGQVKAAQDDLLAARLELAKVQDKYNELLTVVEPMKAIAARAANNMRVALNSSAIDMAAMTPAQVLADHAAMSATFESRFKVGGVASVEAPKDTKPRSVDPMHKARVKAAGFNK